MMIIRLHFNQKINYTNEHTNKHEENLSLESSRTRYLDQNV